MATRSEAGTDTRFRITGLPEPSAISVSRNGSGYENWTVIGPNTIEIETRVAEDRFSVYTGYRSDNPVSGRILVEPGNDQGLASSRMPLRPVDLAKGSVGLGTVSLGCPCCG